MVMQLTRFHDSDERPSILVAKATPAFIYKSLFTENTVASKNITAQA